MSALAALSLAEERSTCYILVLSCDAAFSPSLASVRLPLTVCRARSR